MLLPETELDGALGLAEKIRFAVAEHLIEVCQDSESGTQPEQISVTVSIGVALFEGEAEQTFNAADRALISRQRAGQRLRGRA